MRSGLDQTDTDWDLVVVDDGSDDPAAPAHLREVAERWSEKVHVIVESTNRGAGSARNSGVRWAAARRSPFVVFLDADDLSRPAASPPCVQPSPTRPRPMSSARRSRSSTPMGDRCRLLR